MKNLQLTTLILSFFLSLMFKDVIGQHANLARIDQGRVESNWIFVKATESGDAVANPMITHFSVLPKITVNDDGNVMIYIFNPNRIGINVSFHDKAGHALHRDKTAGLYYGKILNVSDLVGGEYKLTLNSEAVSACYVVKIGSDAREIKVNLIDTL
ncbi:hypothetical protein L0663_01735 [Dyadobacter sp. CY107]|uniref:hypothetical protein n=1 Tax=Dyadobacter fanqingshengii TaxID=2906443 RepID=UPI001F157A48|nr:hypothetical protein [Dyadobacter fanqingshengii]MCF2502086.1 hypothetical protein [Dyadobacter fanqingshengii]